jgi:hypothetical protein
MPLSLIPDPYTRSSTTAGSYENRADVGSNFPAGSCEYLAGQCIEHAWHPLISAPSRGKQCVPDHHRWQGRALHPVSSVVAKTTTAPSFDLMTVVARPLHLSDDLTTRW